MHPLAFTVTALSAFGGIAAGLIALGLGWLVAVLLGPLLTCLLFGKAVDLGLKAGRDNLVVRLAGARAVDTALTVCRAFLTGARLVNVLGETWAQECLQRQRDQRLSIGPGGVCFFGDSEFNFWHHLTADMAAPARTQDNTVIPPVNGCFNAGFGGSRTCDLVQHLEVLCLKHKPRCVVLHNGGNDFDFLLGVGSLEFLWNSTPLDAETVAAKAAENLSQVVDKCRATGVEVCFLLSPRHPVYDDEKWRYACLLADKIMKLCENKSCLLFDLRESLGAKLSSLEGAYYLDGSHMRSQGHRLKADLIRPGLARKVGSN